MIKKFIYIFTAISGILAGVSSCSLDIPPADQYSDCLLYTSDAADD